MYLNCHSFHSLRYGTIPTADLVEMASSLGVRSLALTDINTATAAYDFAEACRRCNVKPVAGMEFREDGRLVYIALAKNMKGFSELCHHRTFYNLEQSPVPPHAPAFRHAFVIYPAGMEPGNLLEHEYIGIQPHQLTWLLRPGWRAKISKMVALYPVTIRSNKEYNLHRIMRAIDRNIILSKLSPDDQCRKTERMLPPEEVAGIYSDHPVLIENANRLLDACVFDFEIRTPKNKKFYTGNRADDHALLTRLAMEGLEKRYGADPIALARVKKELAVIDKLGFSAYFLITWDIISYSNSRGFMHVGRGSGANSIVSYCIGITDICPIELNLYFERFLNPSRTSPPDFDIDWSWNERDDILTYIFRRFGGAHVAFTGTNVEFKYRSIIREMGKVFGLPKEELDALAGSDPSSHDGNSIVKLVHEYGKMIEKYPNMRSMHSCGILISESPIADYTALELPPKGFPIVQFDMHVAEAIGFEKFDILSQRGLGHINDSVQLIARNRGVHVDIRNVKLSKDEARCNEYLKKGKTLGCFYIESPAMRGLLRKLQCDSYKVLVAASSVIRPGVAQSGMMTEYVFRHNNPGKFEYFHPVFKEQLGETYGVMVYQEDVIKIAHHFAGLDLADADILRRAMSGKTRSRKEFEGVRNRFFENCRIKGYSEALSAEVYRQIESFAGYSFCKAHSASYAVESYQSLYLKVYYPVEFMTAVINNFGGFYRTEIYVHEARMAGGNICNPCVNKSAFLTTVYGTDVYLGFNHIKSLDKTTGQLIESERERNGSYASLEDFITRVPVGIEMLQVLIFTGAFRFTGKSKNELTLTGRKLLASYRTAPGDALLIAEPPRTFTLPELPRSPFEDAYDEIELLGFPVSCSPFDLLVTRQRGDVMAGELISSHGKTVRMVGYLVSIKHVPTKQGMMNFGTWIDASGNYFDSAHFAECLRKYPFQGGGCYVMLARVQVDFNFPTLIVEKMMRLPFVPDPRYAENEKDMNYKVYGNLRGDVSMTHRAPYPSESEIGLPRYRLEVDK